MDRTPLKVAVVDDDPSVRRALERLLRASDYEPSTYESGAALLAAVGALRPACVVADLQMPGMTGLELHFNLLAAGMRIPTIIVTGHDEDDARRKCATAGVTAFLLKPLDRDAVVSAIGKAVAGRSRP